jgi:hypothetical protein
MASTINASTSSGLVNTADTSGVLQLQTANTTAVTIDASQNVGIGTASPTEKLDVLGSADTTTRLRASSDTALILNETTPNKSWKMKSSDGTLVYQYSSTAYNSGYSSKMAITSAGQLLVGATTSTYGAASGYMAGFKGTASQTYISLARSGTNLDSDGLAIGVDTGSASIVVRENLPLYFFTNNANRMQINAGAPILCLSGGNTSATGTGIAFPATQSASSDANTLDDYEEGDFTPSLTRAASYSVRVGRYTKIGRVVNFYLNIECTITTGGGIQMSVDGLPFTVLNTSNLYFPCSMFTHTGWFVTGATGFQPQVVPNSTRIDIFGYQNSTGTNYLVPTSSTCGSSVYIELAGSYHAA